MLTLRLLCLGAVVLGSFACSRGAKEYLDRGNKLASENKYQDAVIQYQKALQAEPQFGEATYKLALVELELHNVAEGYRQLTRAVELMPQNQDAMLKLADLSLEIY